MLQEHQALQQEDCLSNGVQRQSFLNRIDQDFLIPHHWYNPSLEGLKLKFLSHPWQWMTTKLQLKDLAKRNPVTLLLLECKMLKSWK